MWLTPPKTLQLSSQEVHVWRASLDVSAAVVQSLLSTLCAEEQQKAERFHFQLDRDRFIVGRGLLREILSRYLSCQPSNLRFCYNKYGKPALLEAEGNQPLRFNLSHSHGLALVAVAQNRNLGIDLEYIRNDFPYTDIAEKFFSPLEKATLRKLPVAVQHKAFFTCWTRKEAYLKATGKGLSLPLDQFDVTFAPDEPAALLNTRWDAQEVCRWSLQELIPDPNYVAAIAVEGDGWQMKCWQWSS